MGFPFDHLPRREGVEKRLQALWNTIWYGIIKQRDIGAAKKPGAIVGRGDPNSETRQQLQKLKSDDIANIRVEDWCQDKSEIARLKRLERDLKEKFDQGIL